MKNFKSKSDFKIWLGIEQHLHEVNDRGIMSVLIEGVRTSVLFIDGRIDFYQQ